MRFFLDLLGLVSAKRYENLQDRHIVLLKEQTTLVNENIALIKEQLLQEGR